MHLIYKSRKWFLLTLPLCVFTLGLAACEAPPTESIGSGRVYYLEQLNQDEVDALDCGLNGSTQHFGLDAEDGAYVEES